MKKSKKIVIMLILICIVILALIYFMNRNNSKSSSIEEYQPEEEISDQQEREAIVSLYFRNKTTKQIEPEARLVDVKKLVDEPYKTLLQLLFAGPQNSNLESTIPNGTCLNNVIINGETVSLDLSDAFIENHEGGKEAEEQTINSIVKTLTQLTEVNSVKILIDGEENKSFNDNQITFDKIFEIQE